MLTQDKKQIKKNRIIEAAFHLFSTKNYHEVMIDDVAKLASIAKGTVYNYFTSKEELYFSIMRLRMEKLLASLKTIIDTETSIINSLHSYVVHLYMFMMKYRSFFLIYRKETLKAENEICTEIVFMETELRKMLQNILKQGAEEGYFQNYKDEYPVDLVMGAINGAISGGIENNLEDGMLFCEREKLFDFILQGMLSPEGVEMLPLKGKSLLITRTVEQSRESADEFRKLGADVITFPTLEIVPPDNWEVFDGIIKSGEKFDYIIFTSVHAVKMFRQRLETLNSGFSFNNVCVVAVGNKTAAACERNDIPIHIIPAKFSGDGVIEELASLGMEGKTVFIPRSALGREELPIGLQKLGAVILIAPVYNVIIPSAEMLKEHIAKLNSSGVDLFIFTSPSAFENFIKIMDIGEPAEYFNGLNIAAIGPTTKSAIENHRVSVSILPEEFNIDGLTKAVLNYYRNK